MKVTTSYDARDLHRIKTIENYHSKFEFEL